MLNEDCDKYIQNVKYGFLIICLNVLLVFIGKSDYFSSAIRETFTTVILIVLAISFVAITILINPYLTCLSKYIKN